MYEVIFYEDSRGNEPTAEFIAQLREKSYTDKNAISLITVKGMMNNGNKMERFKGHF